eukprot:COSAG05_NODE_2830_length_2592_cov_47.594063_4_plen_118_part_00
MDGCADAHACAVAASPGTYNRTRECARIVCRVVGVTCASMSNLASSARTFFPWSCPSMCLAIYAQPTFGFHDRNWIVCSQPCAVRNVQLRCPIDMLGASRMDIYGGTCAVRRLVEPS